MLPAILVPIALEIGMTLFRAAVKKYDSLPDKGKKKMARNKRVQRVVKNMVEKK